MVLSSIRRELKDSYGDPRPISRADILLRERLVICPTALLRYLPEALRVQLGWRWRTRAHEGLQCASQQPSVKKEDRTAAYYIRLWQYPTPSGNSAARMYLPIAAVETRCSKCQQWPGRRTPLERKTPHMSELYRIRCFQESLLVLCLSPFLIAARRVNTTHC